MLHLSSLTSGAVSRSRKSDRVAVTGADGNRVHACICGAEPHDRASFRR